jgi:hypothetical protein
MRTGMGVAVVASFFQSDKKSRVVFPDSFSML